MRTFKTKWLRCNSAHVAPPPFYAPQKCTLRYGRYIIPIGQTFGHSVDGNQMVGGLVARLHVRRCPHYIAVFVMTVVINAMQGIFTRRTPAKMCQKFLERCKAKFNTTIAVTKVFFIFGVIASTTGRTPDSILCGLTRFSVLYIAYSYTLFVQTFARLGSSTGKTSTVNTRNTAALAFAPPSTIATRVSASKAKNGEATESTTSEVYKSRIVWKRLKNNGILVVGHNIRLISDIVIRSVRSQILSTFYIVPRLEVSPSL